MRAMVGRFACGLVAATALAHDLYIMPERFRVSAGETISIALHNGDAFPESEASAPVERLRDFSLRTCSAIVPIRDVHIEGRSTIGRVRVPADGAVMISVHTIPNLITLDAEDFAAYLKEEGLADAIQWRALHGASAILSRERYSKYAVSLIVSGRPGAQLPGATGHVIEIVPEADPSRLKPGDMLPVRVLFRGAPATNLQLESAWSGPAGKGVRVVGRTGADGRAAVPLSHAGVWRLHTIRMQRCAEPKAAEWESFWASLTFEIR